MNINVANIKTTLYDRPNNVFKLWLDFTRPFHKLTNAKIDVLAYILQKRHKLMIVLCDDKLVDSILLSSDGRKDICSSVNIDSRTLNVFLYQFRKDGILYNNNILNPRYIPNIAEDGNKFQLLINFNIDESK